MLPARQWILLTVAIGLLATVAWALSELQEFSLSKDGSVPAAAGSILSPAVLVAVSVPGQVVALDDNPIGDREPILLLHGRGLSSADQYGPDAANVEMEFAGLIKNASPAYDLIDGAPGRFDDLYKFFVFPFDANRNPKDVADEMYLRIEANQELAGKPFYASGYSAGNGVLAALDVLTQGKRVKNCLAIGWAVEGTPLADADEAERRAKIAYPNWGIGGLVASQLPSEADFNSDGMRFLRVDSRERQELCGQLQLDERWCLWAGQTDPHAGGFGGSVLTLAEVLDGCLLAHSDPQVSRQIYALGAGMLLVDDQYSDGVVPIDSALAIHLKTNGVRRKTLFGYNHAEIKDGKGGEMQIYKDMLIDLLRLEEPTLVAKVASGGSSRLPSTGGEMVSPWDRETSGIEERYANRSMEERDREYAQKILELDMSDTATSYRSDRVEAAADFGDDDNDGLGNISEDGSGEMLIVFDIRDSDGDNIPDEIEDRLGMDPRDARRAPDSDGDLLSDDLETSRWGTNPAVADSDGDGTWDGIEKILGTDPLDRNSYPIIGTLPDSADSDGDGIVDYAEILMGTSPVEMEDSSWTVIDGHGGSYNL